MSAESADRGSRKGPQAAESSGQPQEERGEGPDRRHTVLDRRSGIDRRDLPGAAGTSTGLERRRGPGRRLSDFTKSAEEGELTQEQFLFVQAIEAFKKANAKIYPSWTDVLEVIRLLGYRKTCSSEISLQSVEDWKERADAPAGVKSPRRLKHEGDPPA